MVLDSLSSGQHRLPQCFIRLPHAAERSRAQESELPSRTWEIVRFGGSFWLGEIHSFQLASGALHPQQRQALAPTSFQRPSKASNTRKCSFGRAGIVFLDDYDCHRINPRQLRKVIGVVRQDPVLFSGTIDYNIRYAEFDEAHLQSALSSPKLGPEPSSEPVRVSGPYHFVSVCHVRFKSKAFSLYAGGRVHRKCRRIHQGTAEWVPDSRWGERGSAQWWAAAKNRQ